MQSTESEEVRSLLKVKEEGEKVGFKLNIQKTKIMATGPITSCKIDGETVQVTSCLELFVTPWTAANQASLYITNTQSLLKLMSIKLVMSSNHLILPSISPSIRVLSNESVLCIRWPKY